MKSVLVFLLIIISMEIDAQFVLLKDIASGGGSGVGFSFDGAVNDLDGKLYFEASTNNFSYTIWETDGTIEGTKNTIGTSDINGADRIIFGDNKVFVRDFDDGIKLKVFSPDEGIKTVGFFDNTNFKNVNSMGDRAIISGSTIKIYTTDGTNEGSYEFNLTGNSFNTTLTTNDSIGIITDDGFTPNFEPTIIYNNGQSIAELVDYLSPVMALEKVRSAAVIDELILLQDVQNGIVENSIYNVNTKQFAPFEFFGGYIDGFRLDDKVIAISRNKVYAINPDDFSFESLINGEVFAFTSVTVEDGKFYFVAKSFGSSFKYYESDGTSAGTRSLAGTEVSTSSFDPVQAVLDDKLYYIEDLGTSIGKTLLSYNLTTDEIKEIGVASEPTGGLVVATSLNVVNDKLIISRYTNDNGHELYTLDPTINVDEIGFSDLITLQSNLVSDVLTISSQSDIERVSISDASGLLHNVSSIQVGENSIDISDLPSGNHFISVYYSNGIKTYPFVKL